MVFHQRPESVLELLSQHPRVFLQTVLVDDVENCEACGHTYRIAPDRIEVDTLGKRLRYLHARRHRSEGDSIPDSLRHRDEVRHDVEILEAPVVIARATETGLHFIGDAQSTVIARDPVRLTEIIAGAMRRSSHALNRLGDERRDLSWRRVPDDSENVFGALRCDLFRRAGKLAAIWIGRHGVMDANRARNRKLPGVV